MSAIYCYPCPSRGWHWLIVLALQTFVMTFQARKPQPSVYIRALLQSILFGEMKILGTMSIKQLIFDDLAEIVLPTDILLDPQNSEVEVPSDPRFQIAKRMDIFVARAGQVSCALILN